LTKKNKIEKCIRQYILDNKMLKGVISMPSNIFATTGTNVSIMFLDAEKASEEAMLVDATGLGDKVKVDGKNQKTVLKNDEIQKIISTFKEMKEENGFSVVVPLDKIAKNKLSFSAGQYFEAEIKYIDLSPDEFNKKIDGYLSEMEKLFNEEQVSNTEIRDALRRLHYDI
jgi:type I restriction enzyme M protein